MLQSLTRDVHEGFFSRDGALTNKTKKINKLPKTQKLKGTFRMNISQDTTLCKCLYNTKRQIKQEQMIEQT